MTKILRKYHCKDVDLLVASAIVLENAMTHKTTLQSRRSNWADPFFDDLLAEVDLAMQSLLGVDSAKNLRAATTEIRRLQEDSLRILALVKVQLDVDFKPDPLRRRALLKELGFGNLRQARNGSQEALIQLLHQFRLTLTPALQQEIVAKGTAADLLETLGQNADALVAQNILQETHKGFRIAQTAERTAAFNALYEKIIGICKVAHAFFKGNRVVQQQFSFSKIVSGLKT
ncbi:hypothetical protein [Flavobacterium kingsejongi]|uniref:Uncharacterized protein n=1 Tax=Flavobacterium kingsejongi TaxID=1678728 RepID=A0A2S1LNB1_9FLAO|nr:hypothetical protein [Flavobacterium kingsejongi]AWG25247.1 hypothetical protein FK004_08375 [Flavobacterium kingsejongi]